MQHDHATLYVKRVDMLTSISMHTNYSEVLDTSVVVPTTRSPYLNMTSSSISRSQHIEPYKPSGVYNNNTNMRPMVDHNYHRNEQHAPMKAAKEASLEMHTESSISINEQKMFNEAGIVKENVQEHIHTLTIERTPRYMHIYKGMSYDEAYNECLACIIYGVMNVSSHRKKAIQEKIENGQCTPTLPIITHKEIVEEHSSPTNNNNNKDWEQGVHPLPPEDHKKTIEEHSYAMKYKKEQRAAYTMLPQDTNTNNKKRGQGVHPLPPKVRKEPVEEHHSSTKNCNTWWATSMMLPQYSTGDTSSGIRHQMHTPDASALNDTLSIDALNQHNCQPRVAGGHMDDNKTCIKEGGKISAGITRTPLLPYNQMSNVEELGSSTPDNNKRGEGITAFPP